MYVQNTPNVIDGTRTLGQRTGLSGSASRNKIWANFFDQYEITDIADRLLEDAFRVEYQLWKNGWKIAGTLTEWKNFKKDRNWRSEAWHPSKFQLQVFKNGKFIINTPYSQGVGHHIAPKSVSPSGFISGRWDYVSIPSYGKISWENRIRLENAIPATPTLANVLYSLMTDAQTTDGYSFSEWCSEFGYSDDSIKAQKMFLECGETMSAMRPHLDELSEVLADF